MDFYDDFKSYIDLHVHLDGSLSLNNIKELAKLENINLPNKDANILKLVQIDENCKDLNEYLEKFNFPLKLLQTTKALELATYNFLKEEINDGVIYCELRYAPQLHTNNGISQEDSVKAVIKGFNKILLEYKAFKGGIILCCMRGFDNKKENIETIEIAKKYLNNKVLGVDLAGAEGLYPTENFKDIFKLAKEYKIPITIHAGEAADAFSIKQALDIGANRIGHGINALEDEELLEYLKENKIPLELCPKSNIDTKAIKSIEKCGVNEFLNKGIKVTINTDDMTVSNINLKKQYKMLNLSIDEFKQILINGCDAAFTDNKTKEYLKNKVNHNIVLYK